MDDTVKRNPFPTREAYLAMVQAWKTNFNTVTNKELLQGWHFALYALLRGRDYRRAFCERTRDNTRESVTWFLTKAGTLDLSPFQGTVSMDDVQVIRDAGIPEWGAV